MAGSTSEDGGAAQLGEALAEWRSSEQVENGTPSTSPPYWDTDDDDECGPKPSELYGKYTWKIDKFSQINKRELRSNAFEVGGYKWYILIYPQGCDVCNHLSLFLCVANHDKLLPGWSHFAQFTIAVVNKDPKKSKYSDTLHRFWKKEHDWGWKKFMELSKVIDGFIDADTLIIKAQVQVIRERADRPFRCLDCQYRRELVRVYLTNVDQICRKFVEEKRSKLETLIGNKATWSSFCSFWVGIDQNSRRRMSREKTESILKAVVKNFFVEKEVTSTLVMDALYSGLKALEGQIKVRNARAKHLDAEELPVPIVRIEHETFLLVDDVVLLLERAAMEPLPPKDEKGPQNQNRTKDGGSGEDFTKDSIERDERRLTELGRRTTEIFVLDHIFSKIEKAYQEAVALKRQEELIREEEVLAESEQKAKRGTGEKKSKKKQGKQKKNNRKVKDRVTDENFGVAVEIKSEQEIPTNAQKDSLIEDAVLVFEKPDPPEDVSDVSDLVDSVPEILQADSEDRDSNIVNWDTDTSEVHPPTEASSSATSALSSVKNGGTKISSSVMDDSSSTCSTDSLPSVVMNGPYKGSPVPSQKIQKSPSRGKSQRGRVSSDASGWANNDARRQQSEALSGPGQATDVSRSSKVAEVESEAVVISLQDRVKRPEHHAVVKKDEVVSQRRILTIKDDVAIAERPLKTEVTFPPRKSPASPIQPKSESKINVATDPVLVNKQSLSSSQLGGKAHTPVTSAETTLSSKPHAQKADTPKPTEKSTTPHQVAHTAEKLTPQQVPFMSRPLSAPLIPGPRPIPPPVSIVQTAPLLSRSVSAAGRLGIDPASSSHSYIPQSYRNVMMGNSYTSSFSQPHSPNSGVNSTRPLLVSAPSYIPQSPDRMEHNSIRPNISFGMVNHDFQNIDLYNHVDTRRRAAHFPTDFPASVSGRQVQGGMTDEFPHLDIINDLLDDEQVPTFQNFSNETPHHLTRQFTFPGDMSSPGQVGPSTTTCGFERTRSYHDDEFRRGYMYPQANLMPYVNGHVDGMISHDWQMGGSDLSSYLSLRNAESDGYPYQIPDYSNLACGVNGYTVFRPSNGH